jgi:predicted CoA-binding protein
MLRYGNTHWTSRRLAPIPALMPHDRLSDDVLATILAEVRTVAVVGASAKPQRPSHEVMRYLLGVGYHVIPINPGYAGGEILGQPVFARLADVPEPIDLVDVFRRREALGTVVDAALALRPRPKVIWMQLGLVDAAAAARAFSLNAESKRDSAE